MIPGHVILDRYGMLKFINANIMTADSIYPDGLSQISMHPPGLKQKSWMNDAISSDRRHTAHPVRNIEIIQAHSRLD